MAEIPNRTLERGLNMLELLSETADGLTLRDLTERLELPRSTAFNLAQSLLALGYVHSDGGRYRLGLKMFEFGARAVNQVDEMQVIRGYMAEIHAKINETMHLGVRSGTETLYIDKLDSTQSIRMSSFVGARAPLSCTALGKALLSTLADAEIKALYAEHPLAAVTQHSITGMGELLAQMAEIRKLGYAVEREENNGDVCCVAVPLRNREGRAVYALSVSAPLFRTDESRLKHFAALLLEAQPGIERFLKDTHE